jgi:hypothetical protein
MNKFQQSLIVTALAGNLSMNEVKAMNLEANRSSNKYAEYSWGDES